jgi:hypothetical protein
MFQCSQCHTEYGGIRGISADRCPRCTALGDAAAQRPRDLTMVASKAVAVGRSPGLTASSWLGPVSPLSGPLPLSGPIAQLDRVFHS